MDTRAHHPGPVRHARARRTPVRALGLLLGGVVTFLVLRRGRSA